jgi:hypothetical protein
VEERVVEYQRKIPFQGFSPNHLFPHEARFRCKPQLPPLPPGHLRCPHNSLRVLEGRVRRRSPLLLVTAKVT